MGDSPSRRWKPSNHTTDGVDMEILAGDALFPLRFRHIVSQTPSDLVSELNLLRVIAEMARSVGYTGLAAGQLLDLEVGSNAVEFIQEKKFDEMGECSAVCGGLFAGAEEYEVERLRRYGRAVGLLYAVADDILEDRLKADGGVDRKDKGTSYAEGNGVEKAIEKAEERREKAKEASNGFEKYRERVFPLYSFVDYAFDRSFNVDDAGG